ncbi:DMT family transporter [Nocardia otitidiscaviarum]|uniref:DMT family transporter n=1 Tax=Nocardia otitidiscaviarum TaxID=1823 RepID=A0A516NUB0_9NOCA|nr:DMT family transporter [Nocardia otitidiscaviarum]MCP9621872.1 DMT family transporter [Nocardia otitidiscaviarum]QDP82492.1 DMT family transporter [Nocardia otitidiscaviarum]
MGMRRRIGLVCGGSIGAAVAGQARINGELGERLGDGVAAAVISFGTGLVVLGVAFALSGRLRAGVGEVRRALVSGGLRWWQLLGGLCGAFFVACQGLTVAAIGVTAFTVAVVAGQLVSSLAVDRFGIGPAGRTPVTALRAGGAGLALAAVLLSVAGRDGGSDGALSVPESLRGGPHLLLIALPLLAGFGVAWQQAVNGRVGAVGGPPTATLANFLTGTAGLVLVEAVLLAGTGWPTGFPTEPWLYVGGVIGVAFIALAVVVVRWIGVLLLGLTSVAGQLLMSLVLDVAVPTGPGLSATAVLGCALTFVAVTLAARTPT